VWEVPTPSLRSVQCIVLDGIGHPQLLVMYEYLNATAML
jgi:hypothetical protein